LTALKVKYRRLWITIGIVVPVAVGSGILVGYLLALH
jgi:hypothetical protein